MKNIVHIRTDKERDDFIQNLKRFKFVERPMSFEYSPYKTDKSREQEKKYHAMIGEISKQLKFAGESRRIDFWKIILMSAFRKDQGDMVKVFAGLRGEAVPMGLSTRKLGIKEASDFIEFIYAEMADTEMIFSE